MTKRLGELLCEGNHITTAQLEAALETQKTSGHKLGQILCDNKAISNRRLLETLVKQAGLDTVTLEDRTIDRDVLAMVPAEVVSQHSLIPVERQNGRLIVAMAEPFDHEAIADLRLLTGLEIRRCYCPTSDLEKAILKYYGSNVARMLSDLAPGEKAETTDVAALDGDQLPTAKLHELAREPSLVTLVNLILRWSRAPATCISNPLKKTCGSSTASTGCWSKNPLRPNGCTRRLSRVSRLWPI